MHSYSLIAPAKINLYLEILGDRADGYHELVMLLQSISLADRLELRANGRQAFRIHCDSPQMPPQEQNLAYKAAQVMSQQFPDSFHQFGGVDITIEKHIPVSAGLAGGSTNAAAVLVGLNLMWELGLTQPELQEIAAQLGSDIPFCISGGTAIATGRGECLDPINSPDWLWVVLAKYRSLEISTPWAYNTYRQQFGDTYLTDADSIQSRASRVHSSPLVEAIVGQNGAQIGQQLYNDLEKVVLPEHPKIARLKGALQRSGVLGTLMSGSGSTVFALCDSQAQAERIKQELTDDLTDPDLGLWVAQLCSNGIHVGAVAKK
ncbi:4-(cytidine 5'-diphospho)-2-C-methyl-D-erythritol kinase [Lusitaniella coriacea LEGE 07157]|uniref:4-diphosphocytidyl-2-C-methyl-D-erythritol kinase n=1 Tax=Lusitaniella coriacea LEGE 07157 TaxID=945747 RepID=A0A8J7DVZ9_9CYAN|nr:4-(cytidine 5'-diphospho)-2-C-methyl-D-erythritol kinase [Lusitaniella coriacea]MBE9116084.1 4-(cytidine 5'-diphospho)-2-C-methyl-D-erythritol kinase [Lusitaniella coriacea LEGE 07157]